MTASPDFLIIDGHALAYRSFYALPPLTSPDGRPTGAILGFLKQLFRQLKTRCPAAVAVVFDGPGPTFRDELSAEYKATRSPMPPELRTQIDWLKEFVPLLGLRMICEPRVEADDVIASLAVQATAGKRASVRVLILSGDKDLAALVNDRITMLAPSRDLAEDRELDAKGVETKYGVPPRAIPDYLSLVGDSSDNVPGVEGIGEKTAARLIQQYGSLDEVLAHQAELPPRAQKALAAGQDSLALSRKLVQLKCDLSFPERDLLAWCPARLAPAADALARLRDLDLKTMVKELDETPAAAAAPSEARSPAVAAWQRPETTILSPAALPGFLGKIAREPLVVVDTETTSLDPHRSRLVGVAFAAGAHCAWLPLIRDGEEVSDRARSPLRKFLADPAVRLAAHNAKFDLLALRAAGFSPHGFAVDTMLWSYLVDPTRRSQSLDNLARDLLGHESIPFKSLGEDILACPVEQLATYAGEDVALTQTLAGLLAPRLRELGLEKVYAEIDQPLIEVLAGMEWRGVKISAPALGKLAKQYQGELDCIRKRAIHAAGDEEFNLASPQQLGRVLFEKLGLPSQGKTKTGYVTEAAALEAISDLHPLPALVLEYRELAKLLGTYVEALPELINPVTGRVHTSFSQARTATGRLASTDPNLQNLPIRTPRGRAVRGAVVADRGKVLVAADYSQIELRLAAWLAGEEPLLDAMRQGHDFHAATAARLFGRDTEQVDAEARRRAKAVNFGILYGQSAFGLAKTLCISRGEAAGMIDRYFAAFPKLRAWLDATLEQARAEGAVRTWFGRRRPLPDLKAANRNLREAAERTAINTPVQGTAADLMRVAMARVEKRLAGIGEAAIILQVHDELVVETKKSDAAAVAEAMRAGMTEIEPFAAILTVTVAQGRDWLAAGH